MLLIHCPNCQHDNTPGERFCAKCGVPLDLKPCPECGKVDQLTATVCSGCGAEFPPLVVAHLDEESAGAAPPPAAPEPMTVAIESKPPAQGAWPLIIVAIVAGGIPLLWMNRSHIPLPKAWQVQGPNAAGSAPTEVPAAVQATQAPAATETVEARAAEAASAPAPAPAAKPTARSLPVRLEAKAAGKPAADRPCTEALAALGLCNSAAERK